MVTKQYHRHRINKLVLGEEQNKKITFKEDI